MKTKADILGRIREYYECEFPGTKSAIEDTTNIGLAHTYMHFSEVPEKHRWYTGEYMPVQISLDLETLTATVRLGDTLVDSHTFPDYDILYGWLNEFEFEDIFELKIV